MDLDKGGSRTDTASAKCNQSQRNSLKIWVQNLCQGCASLPAGCSHSLLYYRLWEVDKAQPSSSERLAAAFTARMKAPLTPDVSSSARPVMVVPPGLVTLSFSNAGWVTRPSSFASKICRPGGKKSRLEESGSSRVSGRLLPGFCQAPQPWEAGGRQARRCAGT